MSRLTTSNQQELSWVKAFLKKLSAKTDHEIMKLSGMKVGCRRVVKFVNRLKLDVPPTTDAMWTEFNQPSARLEMLAKVSAKDMQYECMWIVYKPQDSCTRLLAALEEHLKESV